MLEPKGFLQDLHYIHRPPLSLSLPTSYQAHMLLMELPFLRPVTGLYTINTFVYRGLHYISVLVYGLE